MDNGAASSHLLNSQQQLLRIGFIIIAFFLLGEALIGRCKYKFAPFAYQGPKGRFPILSLPIIGLKFVADVLPTKAHVLKQTPIKLLMIL